MRRKSKQLTLDHARKPSGRGGWRPGAGRPRGRTKVAHEKREEVQARFPILVTLRAAEGVPSLRRKGALGIVRDAIAGGGRSKTFRVVHFHLLPNHLHLLVEAANSDALARGMQGLNVRIARNLNRVLGREGTLFAERYHARSLKTPTEVRNAIRYVLLNGDHHALERGRLRAFDVDSYSSGAWFDGWADERWMRGEPDERVTAEAATWLLREGWRKGGGPIAFDDTPHGKSKR